MRYWRLARIAGGKAALRNRVKYKRSRAFCSELLSLGFVLVLVTVGMGINSPTTGDASPGAQYFNDILQRMTALFKEQRQANMQVVAAELSAACSML